MARRREAAVAQRDLVERERDRVAVKLPVEVVRVDPRDPLHDVQRPEIGLEAKVPAERQIVDIGRVRRELFRCEVPALGGVRVDLGERGGQPSQVVAVGAGNDVQILGRTGVAVRGSWRRLVASRTSLGPPSLSIAGNASLSRTVSRR